VNTREEQIDGSPRDGDKLPRGEHLEASTAGGAAAACRVAPPPPHASSMTALPELPLSLPSTCTREWWSARAPHQVPRAPMEELLRTSALAPSSASCKTGIPFFGPRRGTGLVPAK
jgi:hypothetical protein